MGRKNLRCVFVASQRGWSLNMLSKITRYLRSIRDLQRLNMSLTRGNIGRSARCVRLSDPQTWEFTGFSQNGEDGILEVLLSKVVDPNRYFVEIGSSDGMENNTTWLSLVGRYSGLWVEADPVTASRSMDLFSPLNHALAMKRLAVTPENVTSIFSDARSRIADVLSLDIDSYDYFANAVRIFAHGRSRDLAMHEPDVFAAHLHRLKCT